MNSNKRLILIIEKECVLNDGRAEFLHNIKFQNFISWWRIVYFMWSHKEPTALRLQRISEIE